MKRHASLGILTCLDKINEKHIKVANQNETLVQVLLPLQQKKVRLLGIKHKFHGQRESPCSHV